MQKQIPFKVAAIILLCKILSVSTSYFRGKFGVIKRCVKKESGLHFAAKFIKKTQTSKEEVMREIDMMNLLHHKRVIQLFDAYETENEMIVVRSW